MSARDTTGRATRIVTVGAVLLVATVAAVVSFEHMREVADRAGEQWRAWLLPLSVDGLVVAASMVLLTRRRAGLPGGRLAWCALLGGVGASLAANIAAAEPTVTARAVAAWPAAAFAVAFELLLQQRRADVVEPVVEPVAEPVAHQPVDSDSTAELVATWRQPPGRDVPPEPVVEHAVEPVVERVRRPAPRVAKAPVARDGKADADLIERVRRAVDVDGPVPGRRQLATQFDVSVHKIRTVLDVIGSNGKGTP